MSTQPSLFDVCAAKHGGDPQSVAANQKAQSTKRVWHARILDTLTWRGEYGATCKEIAEVWQVEMHRISGRISELLVLGMVKKSDKTRFGGRVIVKI